MSLRTLALVTIGQSPREDVTPDIMPFLEGIRVVEAGALDRLSVAEIAELTPQAGETALVSRLRGGEHAVLSEERLHFLLQNAVDLVVADGADAVLIICTGTIASLKTTVPVYMAESFAHGAVEALVGDAELTVIVPESEQVAIAHMRWRENLGREVAVRVCNPYAESLNSFAALAKQLAAGSESWVFLDCIGYSEAMAEAMRAHIALPVLTARSLAARLVASVL